MKTGFKQVIKKTLAWVLTLAMVVGLITVYPSTEAQAGEDGTITLHYYYTGTGTPAISTPTAIDGIEEDFAYWSRFSYFMSPDEVNGDGWYTFNIPSDIDLFQILANSGEAGDDSAWLQNVGYGDAGSDLYEAITAAASDPDTSDIYIAYELSTAIPAEYGGQESVCFFDFEYYDDETEELISDSGAYMLLRELKLQETISNTYDYYIGGAQYDGTDDNGWVTSKGIFSAAYEPVIMSATETEDVYEITLPNKAVKGNTYYYSVYGSPAYKGGFTSADWDNKIIGDASFTAKAEGYVKITANVSTGASSVTYYSDKACTQEIEVTVAKTTFYYYYTGSDVPTLAFSTPIDALNSVGTYWARTAYAMTKVSGKTGWYSFDLLDDYGDFQIVANPSGEDDNSSIWLANFQNENNYETVNFDNKENVYYRGRMFTSLSAALAYTDWDYYISGSTADYDMAAQFSGTSNNIFTNYWSAPIGTYDDNGTAAYYKDKENWADKMTETSSGVYEVALPNKAVKGTSYAFNVYVEKEWNENVYSDAQTFTALANGYVKITVNTNTNKYSVKYYSDAACTKQITVTEDTVRFYVYASGNNVCIVFNGNMESDLDSLTPFNTYWGNNAYKMTREVVNNKYTGWYYYDVKASYGSFQIVANPHGENVAENTEDDDNTKWIANVYDDNYASVLAGNAYLYRGKYFTSKSKATAYTNWQVYIAGGISVNSEPEDSKKASYKGIFTNFWATSNENVKNEDGTDAIGDDGNIYYEEEWADQMSGNYSSGTYTYKSVTKTVKGKSYSFGVYYEKSWNDLVVSDSFTAAAAGYVKFTVNVKTGKYSIKYYSDKACTKQIALSKPTGLTVKTAGTTGYGKVKLSWKKVTNATKYEVYANGKKVGTTTSTSYTYTKATAGKTVKYTVKAASESFATSAASAAKSVYVPKAVAKKTLKAKRLSNGTVKLTWKKVSGATGYIIQRSTKKSSGFKNVQTIKKASTLKWTDTNSAVKKGKKTYYYRVVAYKKVGSVNVLSKYTTTLKVAKK